MHYDLGKGVSPMSVQSAGIDIVPETIGHILEGKNLRVPLSQRSYRWKDEHVNDLYNDINAAILDNLDEYFLGSIVGIKSQGRHTFMTDNND